MSILTILCWVISIIFILAFIVVVGGTLRANLKYIPWLYYWWLLGCILIIGPAKYLMFQLILFCNLFVHSLFSFSSTLLVFIFYPIVFIIEFFICVGLPGFLFNLAWGGINAENISNKAKLLCALMAPLFCLVSSYILYFTLLVIGISTSNIKVNDLLIAAEGPVTYYFDHFIQKDSKLIILPNRIKYIDHNSKDLLQNHLMHIYLSENQYRKYLLLKSERSGHNLR